MARALAALQPVDGNAVAQQAAAAAAAAACAAHQQPPAAAPRASNDDDAENAAPAGGGAGYVPAATQDAVAAQCLSDQMKNQLRLSPNPSAAPPAQESPAFTPHCDSVRSMPSMDAAESAAAAAADTAAPSDTAPVRVDEFLALSLHYVAPSDAEQVGENFGACAQRLVASGDDGCDIDATIPQCGAQDVTAGRVLVAVQLTNSHDSDSYTVQLRVDGGPPELLTVPPGETALATAPAAGNRSGRGSPFEMRGRRRAAASGGSAATPSSPRSASISTADSVSCVFTRPEGLGIVFDECVDARDGERYLVVSHVHPNTQAAELLERTSDGAATSSAALICPGMVVQKISAGDEDSEVHVSSLYREYGQVPPHLFAMRPLGLVMSAREHGVIEAELLQRPGDEKPAEAAEQTNAPPLVRIRVV